MNHTDQRKRLRNILAGSKCLSPASVFDPLSARVAESVGFELGLLAGSVASSTTLAAPDLIVVTLTEVADQIRRIMRACNLSLIVDADHGYGNALNVMRTTQELEHAGVSLFTIEDTALPLPFGQDPANPSLISIPEGVGKMRAALAAREDPSLIIAARTSALTIEGLEGTIARLKAYADCGVDAVFFGGLKTLSELDAIHAAVKLPIILGNAPESLKREDLAARGVRVTFQGHQSVAAAVKGLHDLYTHLFNGGSPAEIASKVASGKQMAALTGDAKYSEWIRQFLR